MVATAAAAAENTRFDKMAAVAAHILSNHSHHKMAVAISRLRSSQY